MKKIACIYTLVSAPQVEIKIILDQSILLCTSEIKINWRNFKKWNCYFFLFLKVCTCVITTTFSDLNSHSHMYFHLRCIDYNRIIIYNNRQFWQITTPQISYVLRRMSAGSDSQHTGSTNHSTQFEITHSPIYSYD